MRFFFAILAVKLLTFAARIIGRSSTNLPGRVALRLCPDALAHIKCSGKVIAITGSNGKTTTSNLIAHILRQNGHSVVNNVTGSNLTPGIVTTLLRAASFGGLVSEDYVVLETDERYIRFIFKYWAPNIMLVTNLLRDQVVRNGNPDLVMDKINEGIAPEVLMVLNGNDPISQTLAPNNPRVYFDMERTSLSANSCDFFTNDAKVCPHCFGVLEYEFYHYNHIGSFNCPRCGFATPTPNYTATDIDYTTGDFRVNGHEVHTDYRHAQFHYLNMAAAIGSCVEAGLTPLQATRGASTFVVSRERYDEFDIGDERSAVLVMTKQNPVSMDQSISYTLAQTGDKTVVFYVNNAFYTENKDISWIYDVTYERLLGHVDAILCSGSRAYDLRVRMELAGFDCDRLFVDTDPTKLRDMIKKTRGKVYILAATAFGDDDGVLEALKS